MPAPISAAGSWCIDRTCDMLPGVRRAAESVFGREDRRQAHAAAMQQVDQMLVAHARSLVGKHGHAAPAQQREVGRRIGRPDRHPVARPLRRGRRSDRQQHAQQRKKQEFAHRLRFIVSYLRPAHRPACGRQVRQPSNTPASTRRARRRPAISSPRRTPSYDVRRHRPT